SFRERQRKRSLWSLPLGRWAAAMEGEPPPVEERRRLQEELSEFVESCCRTLEEVTASLGWDLDRGGGGEGRGHGARFGDCWPAVFCGTREIHTGSRGGKGEESPFVCRAAVVARDRRGSTLTSIAVLPPNFGWQ
ncbi:hypothetical protein P7K49_007367, partial [Saguinus oedipus]